MEQMLKEILPIFGRFRYIVLAMAILYYAYPHLRKYWHEYRFRNAQLDHALKELQLVKLRYEIEALAKEKGLPLPTLPGFLLTFPSYDASPSPPSKIRKGIRPISRFFYAALGCLLVFGIRFAVDLTSHPALPHPTFLIGAAVYIIIAGTFGLIFGRESPLRSFVIGALAPIVIPGFFSMFIQSPGTPPVHSELSRNSDKITFAMWSSKTPYDESRHLASIANHLINRPAFVNSD